MLRRPLFRLPLGRAPRARRADRTRRRSIRVEELETRTVPALVPLSALTVDPTSYDSSSILVQLEPGPIDPNALGIPGATAARPLGIVPGLWEIQLAAGSSAADALLVSQASPFIQSASFNYHLSISATPTPNPGPDPTPIPTPIPIPTDPQYASQWALNNTGQTGGTPDADIDAYEAWSIFTGSPSTIVAVIDTGIDYTHPDLVANIWTNAGEIAGNGIDDDANGYIDDVHGYDFANNDSDPMDDHSHGTHVAGIIGAANNGIGIVGVNWNVQLMALKAFDASGNGTVANAMRALDYALQMGAQISNNSYGSQEPDESDPLFEQAIRNAADFGHIFVTGAGNETANNDVIPHFPSNFDADNIVVAAATDHNDALAFFSNFGANTVDLAAPGVDILSTLPNNQYGLYSGTSMSTPHVTGVISLVQGLHPDWTYRQIIDQVLNTVDYLPGLDGRTVTGGRLNAARALADFDGPRVVGTDPSGEVGGVVSRIRVFFNEPIDPATLGVDDIASFTGPAGAIAVTSITPVPGSFNRKFDVNFAAQTARGNYEMVIGPAVNDAAGNAMDQDGDGVFGEPVQDQFTATFTIGDQYVFHSTDTPKPLAALAVTRSYLTVTDDLSIADLDVRINIVSPDVGFLNVTLISPTGARSALVPMTGNPSGPEFRDTVFSDEALTPISGGSSPFAGTFQPSTPLSAMDNQSTQGTWTLEIMSLYGGSLNSWSLLVVANPPRITIGDVALPEGNTGTTPATFTVRLSNSVPYPVTVDFATADGTATAGSDYDGMSGTLTFAPGETTKTIVVPVRGDNVDELDETFVVNLTGATGGTISNSQATGTIKNDERTVSIGDVAVTEGDANTVTAAFTLTLSAPSSHPVTVTYTAAPGTASAGTDYVPVTGSVTFEPGVTTRTAAVSVKGDTRYERNETFFVNITAVHAMVADDQGTGTVVNDDPVPLLTVNDVSVLEGDSGTRYLVYNVQLSSASDYPVTVNYATANGTATAGSDYTATSGTLTFNPGNKNLSVSVPVAGDTNPEPSETVLLNLSGISGAILMDGQGIGTILTDDQSLSIGDVTVTETDVGTFATTFTVTLSSAVPFDVSVNYSTANGTATAGSDFVAASGTVTFAPGETTRTVTILGIGDTRNELQETFFVNLTGAVNAVIADSQGKGTIDDTDPIPSVSISDAVVVEGSNGTRNLTFTLTLSAISGQNVVVNYATADGTATAGSDYTAAAGAFTINAGNKTQTFNVVVAGDTTGEADESLFVNLSNPINATLADTHGVGTIQDDDSLVINDVTLVEGNSGTAVARFTVRLLAARTSPVTVDFATANGTASAGIDYLAASGTLTFAPGETTKTVDVIVIGDRGHEADETIQLNLSNATGTILADGRGIATITNDDAMPSVTVSDAVVIEGNSGTRNAVFTFTLSQPSGQSVSVSYSTADGSATTANLDYQPKSGTLSIGAGSLTGTVTVPVNGDTGDEGDETFLLALTGSTNATLADTEAVATIIDDDPLPVVSISDASTSESNSGTKTISFTVSLSAPSTQTITVLVSTSNGTATAGSDYTATTQTVTFAPGQTSKGVNVVISGDTAPEPTETLLVTLSNSTNATLGDPQGVGSILNDDTTLRVGDVTVTEGDGGDATTTVTFMVNLTGPLSADPVTVGYFTSNGTAVAGTDFVGTSGILSFAPGETSKTVEVLVADDRIDEFTETFNLNLQNAVNATIADAVGVGTINDDADPAPTMSVADVAITEGASGTKNLTFTVRLSTVSGKTVTASYATANGTALAGTDYQSRTGVLTFGPGSISQSVNVPINGDTTGEVDETFFFNLSNVVNSTLSDGQAVGTIQDDDSLIVDDVTVIEGDTGATVARFTVRLLAARDYPVTVDFTTGNSTAAAGSDFVGTLGTLTFAPGETEKTVEVSVVGDRLDEADETFQLNLSNAVGAVIADNRGIGTITDDDATPTVSISDVMVAEGNAGARTVTFVLTLSAPSGQNVRVDYSTADGTATAAAGDYVSKGGSVTFGPGTTTQTVSVTVNGDTLAESNETFYLNLLGVTNGILADNQAMATIIDDDGTLSGGGGSIGGTAGVSAPPAPGTGSGPGGNGRSASSPTEPRPKSAKRPRLADTSALGSWADTFREFAEQHGIILGSDSHPGFDDSFGE